MQGGRAPIAAADLPFGDVVPRLDMSIPLVLAPASPCATADATRSDSTPPSFMARVSAVTVQLRLGAGPLNFRLLLHLTAHSNHDARTHEFEKGRVPLQRHVVLSPAHLRHSYLRCPCTSLEAPRRPSHCPVLVSSLSDGGEGACARAQPQCVMSAGSPGIRGSHFLQRKRRER